MTVKIAHLSDIHIRNLKYHDVYREVFNNLYAELKTQDIDYIVVTGDVAHTKTQISPEYVAMASDFFDKLSDIAKTIIIPGNHDGNLKNPTRLDAITPIVNNLNKGDIYFSRDSDVITFEDVDFYHLSVFDTENWPQIVDEDKINIALFHGAVSGIKTDMGHEITHGDAELSDFEHFDYGLFGDIHKTNQKITEDGRMRYPGSLICQNFGETNDKGYLVWELHNKKKFDVVHKRLKNPKPFITINLTPTGNLPQEIEIPNGSRVRLVASESISLDRMKKVVDIVKSSYKIESVSFLNRSGKSKDTTNDNVNTFGKKNIRDIAVQEELIKDYLKEYKISDEVMTKVMSLNREVNSEVEGMEQTARNVEWKVKSIEWDNLFNYGEGNKINFDKLEGIIGIFGKSYSGKSSIIDALLYSMFNSTSKSITKNYDLINQHMPYARGKVVVEIDHKDYIVERNSEKYTKKLKGVETEEARTNVDFSLYDQVSKTTESLNGITRSETDAKIRNQFGTLDDFMVTSLAAQFGSLTFIDQKSTDRKKILGKFLDLDFFEEKFKTAKNHSSDLRGALKIMETRDLDQEFKNNMESLAEVKDKISSQQAELSELENDLITYREKFSKAKENLESIPQELGKPVKEAELNRSKQIVNNLQIELDKANESLTLLEESVENTNRLYEELENEDDWEKKLRQIEELHILITQTTNDLLIRKEALDQIVEAEENIKNAPCNNEYSDCMLVERAWETLNKLGGAESFRKVVEDLNGKVKDYEEQKNDLSPERVFEAIDKLESLERNRREDEKKKTAVMSLIISKTKELKEQQDKNDILEKAYENYCKNKEAFEDKENYEKNYEKVRKDIQRTEQTLKAKKDNLNTLFSKQGYYDQRLENILEEKEKLNNLREEYAAYDLYKKCMHPNGIPFDIIKRRLPEINEEISKILSTIVEFEIFFEAQDNKLEVYIKHPKHDPRPIETGSGAEKTLAATAIRLALLAVSSLPKGDIFILDEPATELDEDTKEGFVRILDMIKIYFKNVILISHLESLKDVVDTQITIEKKNGYAFVNVI